MGADFPSDWPSSKRRAGAVDVRPVFFAVCRSRSDICAQPGRFPADPGARFRPRRGLPAVPLPVDCRGTRSRPASLIHARTGQALRVPQHLMPHPLRFARKPHADGDLDPGLQRQVGKSLANPALPCPAGFLRQGGCHPADDRIPAPVAEPTLCQTPAIRALFAVLKTCFTLR